MCSGVMFGFDASIFRQFPPMGHKESNITVVQALAPTLLNC